MPTAFVGAHLLLAAVIAAFGSSFILDPCGGGGDLCLGGILGLTTLGLAGLILVGIAVWVVARRASPLLLLDSLLVAIAGYLVLATATYQSELFLLGAQAVVIVGCLGGVVAGRAVATHRLEPLLVLAVLIGFVAVAGVAGAAVLVLGLLGLGAGWLIARDRTSGAPSPASPPPPA